MARAIRARRQTHAILVARPTPCGACGACSPCNPCAAGGSYSAHCVAPRLVTAALCNPCPAANPCGPGGAYNPCDPCAAANPCNPCGPCGTCNPCNPCAGAETPLLTDAEAAAAFDCIKGDLVAAYSKSGIALSGKYQDWRRYSTVPYLSDAHGLRYVNNYANDAGRDYGMYEEAGDMPPGAITIKESFVLSQDGRIGVGPLFTIEKHAAGTFPDRRDWPYSMVMPNGSVQVSAAIQKFCNVCHIIAGDEDDYLMFFPDEYRASAN